MNAEIVTNGQQFALKTETGEPFFITSIDNKGLAVEASRLSSREIAEKAAVLLLDAANQMWPLETPFRQISGDSVDGTSHFAITIAQQAEKQ